MASLSGNSDPRGGTAQPGWSMRAQEGRVEAPEGLRRRFPKVQVLLREREETGSPGTGRTTKRIRQLLHCRRCRGHAGVMQGPDTREALPSLSVAPPVDQA